MSQRGTLRKRGETWTAYWWIRQPDGTWKQRSKGGFRTKRDAQGHLTTVLGKVQDGTYSEPKRMTVATYLTDFWLPSLDKRPTTMASYRSAVQSWILPHLGGLLLTEVTPAHVEAMVRNLRANGGRRGQGLSARTSQYSFVVLGKALSYAVRGGFLSRNPLTGMDRPQSSSAEMKHWSSEEAAAFLDAVSDDRLFAAWSLFLGRGFRRGELAGLRWADVDLETKPGRIAVTHTVVLVDGKPAVSEPKTAAGRRSVPLDASLVAVLRAHRRRQLEERLAWGEAWQDTGYVFCREDGSPVHPETFSTAFECHQRRAGVRMIRLHDCRHTAATLALEVGVPTEVVSKWLGHSSVAITQDIYQHVTPSMMEDAGERLSAAINRHRKK